MTVNEFFECYCQSNLKIMSGYNGKVLCKRFIPKKHIEIGTREITSVWAEIEVPKSSAFRQSITPIICVYVDGTKEYEKENLCKERSKNEQERICH